MDRDRTLHITSGDLSGLNLAFFTVSKLELKIKVVKGACRKHGINLDIKRGQAVFAGGSISNPYLDILAVREAENARAGIIVSGTATSRVVKLYSDPPMTEEVFLFGRNVITKARIQQCEVDEESGKISDLLKFFACRRCTLENTICSSNKHHSPKVVMVNGAFVLFYAQSEG